MIVYTHGVWGFRSLFRIRGSIFPKAAAIAVPSALLCLLFNYLQDDFKWCEDLMTNLKGMDKVYSGFTTVLGFIMVFRNNQAYSRYRDGASSIMQVRGHWFKGVSLLISFCSRDPAKKQQVERFQFALVRLASALYCFALQQVCDLEDDKMEIIKMDSIDPECRNLLAEVHDRVEVVVQWIQQLIIEANDAKVLEVPPPILNGALGEFGSGAITLEKVQEVSEIPFPFPYSQTLTCMLLIHALITPISAATTLVSWTGSTILVLVVVGAFWALHFIAMELDQPFGDDSNDLPMKDMQVSFNRSLLLLLHNRVRAPPKFDINPEEMPAATLCACDSVYLGSNDSEKHGHKNRFEKVVEHMPEALQEVVIEMGDPASSSREASGRLMGATEGKARKEEDAGHAERADGQSGTVSSEGHARRLPALLTAKAGCDGSPGRLAGGSGSPMPVKAGQASQDPEKGTGSAGGGPEASGGVLAGWLQAIPQLQRGAGNA